MSIHATLLDAFIDEARPGERVVYRYKKTNPEMRILWEISVEVSSGHGVLTWTWSEPEPLELRLADPREIEQIVAEAFREIRGGL